MLEIEKKFLNTCIKKHIKNKYTQEEFAKGITDKYMISRLFHGYTTKTYIYEALLKRLHFYYDYSEDFVCCDALYSSLLLKIESNDRNSILDIIHTLISIITKHNNHIYFEELKSYVSLLKTHYIDEKSIDLTSMDFSTLSFMPLSFRISMIHTICENLLFTARFNELKHFYNTIDKPERFYVLLEYWQMIIEQGQKKTIEAHKIYRNNMYRFIENNDYFNMARFLLVNIQSDIRKHPDTALNNIRNLESKCSKQIYNFRYMAMIPFIYSVIYIRDNKCDTAYPYIIHGMQNYPYARNIFFPYYVILSILFNKDIDTCYSFDTNSLNKACMHLYDLYKKEAKRDMLKYIIQTFPKECCENPYFETLIPVFKLLILQLSKQTRSYKNVVMFMDEYQKYNKNYYM